MSWLSRLIQPEPDDRIDGRAARAYVADGALLIDVRTRAEFAEERIEGSTNIPLSELPRHLDEFEPQRVIVVCCRTGHRSSQAHRLLTRRRPGPVYDLGAISRW